jgi:hypothetical protein
MGRPDSCSDSGSLYPMLLLSMHEDILTGTATRDVAQQPLLSARVSSARLSHQRTRLKRVNPHLSTDSPTLSLSPSLFHSVTLRPSHKNVHCQTTRPATTLCARCWSASLVAQRSSSWSSPQAVGKYRCRAHSRVSRPRTLAGQYCQLYQDGKARRSRGHVRRLWVLGPTRRTTSPGVIMWYNTFSKGAS